MSFATMLAPVAPAVAPVAPVSSPFRSLNRMARKIATENDHGDIAARSKVVLQAMAHSKGFALIGKGGYGSLTHAELVQLLTNDGIVDERPIMADSVADLRSRAIARGLGKSAAGKADKASLEAYVTKGTVPTPRESNTDKLRRIARDELLDGRGKATTAHALVCLIRSKCINADALLAGLDETKIAKDHASRRVAKETGLTATVCRQIITYAIASRRIDGDLARGRSSWKADELRTFVQTFGLDVPADDTAKIAA